jgi:hypothetical protein
MDFSSNGKKASRVPSRGLTRYQLGNDIGIDTRERPMRSRVESPQHRRMQSLRQVVKFENCLFENNVAGPPSEFTHYGVIFAETPNTDLVVTNSIFWYNTFAGPGVVVSALARVYPMRKPHTCGATLTNLSGHSL